ncbi:phage integrase central domain-containing protein [Brucella pituitosa]|uniref:phage integrase central domain-containing protein n=1 Tax=Brucella pituitosa TaxID=571256 RepID=UPI0009A257CC|nr:hypothetical protein [Brucella pituitosa]
MASKTTFAEVMDDVLTVKRESFKNDKHKSQWSMTLENYAKNLHRKAIADIARDDILNVLKRSGQKYRKQPAERGSA